MYHFGEWKFALTYTIQGYWVTQEFPDKILIMVGVELSSRFSQMVMIDVLNWFNYFEENGKHLCVKLNQLGINVPS